VNHDIKGSESSVRVAKKKPGKEEGVEGKGITGNAREVGESFPFCVLGGKFDEVGEVYRRQRGAEKGTRPWRT